MSTKSIYLILIYLIISISLIKAGCPTIGPELWIKIDDNEDIGYKIFAVKADNSPVYDENYNFTSEFNTAKDIFFVTSGEYPDCEGFDWIIDQNAVDDTTNDDLGYGFYKIGVIREYASNPDTILTFYYDTRMDESYGKTSIDVWVYLTQQDNNSFVFEKTRWTSTGEFQTVSFSQNDTIKIWENHWDQEKDFSYFTKEIEMTNEIAGSSDPNQEIYLLDAKYSFPEENYQLGQGYSPGTNLTLWHSVEYKFGVDSNVVVMGGTSYLARHWNSQENTGFQSEVLIQKDPSFTQVKAVYEPTHPLTVTNNLEGGSGGEL